MNILKHKEMLKRQKIKKMVYIVEFFSTCKKTFEINLVDNGCQITKERKNQCFTLVYLIN
jgi:hypothetical protein